MGPQNLKGPKSQRAGHMQPANQPRAGQKIRAFMSNITDKNMYIPVSYIRHDAKPNFQMQQLADVS